LVVDYPIGHRRRRAEGMPLLIQKFAANIASRLAPEQCQTIMDLCVDPERLRATPVDKFMDMFISNSHE
jgi:2-methylcitrate dehydratase